MRKWPGFCKELVNIFGAVKGLVKFFFHLLWPILEGRWIFRLIASFKHTWWREVERNCRRKHKKAKACHPHTFVSSPEVLEFQGWVCTSCDGEGVKGQWFCIPLLKAAGTRLLLQSYEALMKDLPFPRRTSPDDKCFTKVLWAVYRSCRQGKAFLSDPFSFSLPHFACELQYSVSRRCLIWQGPTTSSLCS